MIKKIFLVVTSILATSCTSKKEGSETINHENGDEAVISVAEVHRYPREFEGVRVAPIMIPVEMDHSKDPHKETDKQAHEEQLKQ